MRTLDLLKIRKEHGRAATGPSTTLGLVVEGGGMRGTISCAYAEALLKLGFGDCFDHVYGTSAGALNGAYFLSGQSALGTSIYYDSLCTKDFINVFRWPDPMDINFLFEHWVCGQKALDIHAVLCNEASLAITATDCITGEAAYFSSKELDGPGLIQAMRASASSPMFTTKKESIGGHQYNDGMINDGIPLLPAIREGCTHIVCLLTRPFGYRKTCNTLFKLIENIRLRSYSSSYIESFHSRQAKYNAVQDMIEGNSVSGVDIISIAPHPEDFMVKNGEIDREKLTRAAVSAVRRACIALGFDSNEVRMGLE